MNIEELEKKILENNMKMETYRSKSHMITGGDSDYYVLKMKDLIHQVNVIMWKDYHNFKKLLSNCIYKNFYNFILRENIIDEYSEFQAIDGLIREKTYIINYINHDKYEYKYYTNKEKQDSLKRNIKALNILKDLKVFLEKKYIVIKTWEEYGVRFSKNLTTPITYKEAEAIRYIENSKPRHNSTNKYFVKEVK